VVPAGKPRRGLPVSSQACCLPYTCQLRPLPPLALVLRLLRDTCRAEPEPGRLT